MLGRLTDGLVTGEWERGPTAAELRAAAGCAGLSIESLAHYALSEVKDAERYAASATRQLWLAFEETLAAETARPVAPGLYSILYLRACRPGDDSPRGDTRARRLENQRRVASAPPVAGASRKRTVTNPL